MSERRRRYTLWAATGLLVTCLGVLAAGCGGDDEPEEAAGGGAETQAPQPSVPGLGATIEEIRESARAEGQVNLIIWPGYAVRTAEFTADTGCKVNTKDGASSDDMIALLQSGAYDGGSFSGNASVRLMTTGDVAPVDTGLISNFEDIQQGIRNQDYNSRDGDAYGVPHGRGPNLLIFRTDALPESTDSWGVIWDDDQLAKYKGKISIYDDSIFIADAALYLKATRPALGIESPYQLTQEQFDAAVDLLKKQAPNVGEYWPGDVVKQIQSFTNADSVVGTTWPYQVNQLNAEKVPIKAIKPKEGTTGWSDTWMIYSKAKNPNCMYLWMDHMASPESQATVAEAFGEAPVNLKACALTKNPNHCDEFHADDEAWWQDVYYWTTPAADCGDPSGGETCVTQADWKAAWTEIRG